MDTTSRYSAVRRRATHPVRDASAGGCSAVRTPRGGGVFYGCSNFPLCEHTALACPRCGNGLPVRSGRGLPLPRLRRGYRGLSGLRRLAEHQDGQVRPLSRLLELPGLRLHEKPAAAVAKRAGQGIGHRRTEAAVTGRHCTPRLTDSLRCPARSRLRRTPGAPRPVPTAAISPTAARQPQPARTCPAPTARIPGVPASGSPHREP